jgi:single-stranded-DNA-specific exonuclease
MPYRLRDEKSVAQDAGANFSDGDLLTRLLAYRGITDPNATADFLNPSYETQLHDPFLMKGMAEAVKRIRQAVAANEHIIIYSDYDCDGIPAAVILSDFFKGVGYANVEVYIPHRHKEGFGLHHEAIESFTKRPVKPTLLITLDCGITDVADVAYANEQGIDVIVTDHHEPLATLPPAFAILDPKQPGCQYPFKELCGSGVAFKLVQGLIANKDFTLRPGTEKWLLDMVGIATLSDMVPLVGENRVFAHYGLMVLRKSRRPGITQLLRLLRINQRHVTEDDIGFMIAPRINAASRMGVPSDAFELLSTTSESRAGELAAHLNKINDERKGLVGSLVKEVNKIMNERADHFLSRQVIVLGNPAWRPAILGLAANSLMETYSKPVFLWGREDGIEIKGSCRSDGSVNLVELMTVANSESSAFSQFGGHRFSGGFSVPFETIHTLEDQLEVAFEKLKAEKEAKQQNGSESGAPEETFIDAVLPLSDISWRTYGIVEKLAPFGVGNPKPLFLFKNAPILSMKQFGKTGDHLELSMDNSRKAIAFFSTPESFTRAPAAGQNVDLVGHLEKSMFRYTPELRIRIVDIV